MDIKINHKEDDFSVSIGVDVDALSDKISGIVESWLLSREATSAKIAQTITEELSDNEILWLATLGVYNISNLLNKDI